MSIEEQEKEKKRALKEIMDAYNKIREHEKENKITSDNK